jgi:hypothetical protein
MEWMEFIGKEDMVKLTKKLRQRVHGIAVPSTAAQTIISRMNLLQSEFHACCSWCTGCG